MNRASQKWPLAALLLACAVVAGAPLHSEKESNPDKGPKMMEYTARAKITLGDDRSVKGKSTFQAPETFIFQHNRDGVLYEKTIHAKDVRALHFEKWKPVKVGENKEGDVYRFEVTSFQIELKDGYTLQVNNGIPAFWQSFVLENDNGRVRFFTYWMDLLKKDSGKWFTGMEGPASGERSFCHKDVIRSIEFFVD
ncbi:MAG: hypothetical protein KDK37_11265 [Leptospiraceae bacterium]|nr:hypothetical protein [Leptospiraceae bacterium]MCB1304852.1 hypothetical protein [Leptospiraceae bacterium]